MKYLQDLWDNKAAQTLDEPELLRYRSNLLGCDLRITNFGGGNTSSKIAQEDPLDGSRQTVLWVKGSGGDLGSIKRAGFATLYMEKLRALESRYRGREREDEMVGYYPLCTFGVNPVAASIDTPLHGLLPFAHIDHLHPDWAIALAAAANGKERLEEFNRRFGHRLVWLPWQRPGFELALMLRNAVAGNPGCDGIILGGHGLFTWGETQRECYLNTLKVIDDLGQFVLGHMESAGVSLFGGAAHQTHPDRREIAAGLFPFLRGRVSGQRRLIGSFSDSPEVLRFVNAVDATPLSHLGTSCPDHFVRTKIRPLFVGWNSESGAQSASSGSAQTLWMQALRPAIDEALSRYRKEYEQYYRAHARGDSPAMRDPNPTVVLIPGIGMFSFGKTKAEARITGEFYTNAIHVMEGATGLGAPVARTTEDARTRTLSDVSAGGPQLPQAGAAAKPEDFNICRNYVALPLREAFNIEYWLLEEAKLRRMPPEKEFSRQVLFVVGGGNGIGRETVILAAKHGASVVVADRDEDAAKSVAEEAAAIAGKDAAQAVALDVRDRESIRAAVHAAVMAFGGVDILVNTAALFAAPHDGHVTDEQWRLTLDINVTGSYLLVDELRSIFGDQGLPAAVVLTSSANAVVPKMGSEAYDVSKAAVSHLIRELAIALAPHVRVNGVSPATVVKGSTMFPRDRVIASLTKYGITHSPDEPTEELRNKLAAFYAKRTLLHGAIEPIDCAEAILFLACDRARRTSGHLIPVDGGLTEAFLR
jgi:rhamnose utilization protein RhaD (predicted bifunctional aldolase and dehydrogenase)/NAD(P)-dependent dehydrogenase (short-subunit alcohol dehydrogenase family)